MKMPNVFKIGILLTIFSVISISMAASDPSPTNGAIDVPADIELSWTGGEVYYYKVYFGTDSTPDSGEYIGNQGETTYKPSAPLNYSTKYYWRIDNVNASGTTAGAVWSFTTPPENVSSPSPGDGATDVSVSTDLSWTAGSGVTSYDVYLGTSSPGTFQGNQTSTTFEPNTLGGNATYYWRIDEVNEGGRTIGTVWSFTTLPAAPAPASGLFPANSATGVPINAKLKWAAGAGATSHNVYFGTTAPGTFQGNQTNTTFDPGTLANETTYYWRIDEVNSDGTTTGTVWSFTTDFLRLKPEEFAIHAWNEFYGFDAEIFKGVYDCGFNLAGFVRWEDLDLVDAAGLKAHIRDYDFYARGSNLYLSQEEMDAIATDYANLVGDHPALFGYFLIDEPPSVDYSNIAKWVDAFHTADPDKQTYINLPPCRDVDWDDYVSTVQNDFLSYDLYGMREDGSVDPYFWLCLEKTYLASVTYSLPFWNTVGSVKLLNEKTAYPSPANLRLQAFASLAYGVRGISWFIYFPAFLEHDSLTPIDLDGTKRDIWYMLRDVNFQLHRIGQIYITLNSVNVFHDPNVPSEMPGLPGSQGISSSHHIDSLSGGDFCVGEFNDPSGHPYIMLVNKSLTETSNFNVTFKQSGTMYWVNSATGQLETLEADEMYLQPGEGMLITVQ